VMSPTNESEMSPPNQIAVGCTAITPAMLPLVDLTTEEIARIVERVPGGAANVQDIYPLASLQEGILFHHMMGGRGDPYLLSVPLTFANRSRLDAYLAALRAVVARHDILRTSVVWEGVSQPVQVVHRAATVPVVELALDPGAGDIATQLGAACSPRHHRIDVREAPWIRVYIAEDLVRQEWAMVQLLHHLAGDHTTLGVLHRELEAHLRGATDKLPPPLPFRNVVAQQRLRNR
jgi:hypothetical protein